MYTGEEAEQKNCPQISAVTNDPRKEIEGGAPIISEWGEEVSLRNNHENAE